MYKNIINEILSLNINNHKYLIYCLIYYMKKDNYPEHEINFYEHIRNKLFE